MGNTSSSAVDGKDSSGLDDLQCLEIPNSAIFNDNYASEIYDSLPNYEGTVLDAAADDASGSGHSTKMKRLLEIFGKPPSGAPSVEDFPDLRVRESDELNGDFVNMVKVRTRLLQRIHYAYSRRFNMTKLSKTSSSSSEKFLRSMHKGGAGFDNADALLTATSIKMSLSIMACLGPQNPELFKQFSASLQDLLSRCPPLALSKVLSGSPQGESVRAIVDYAGNVVSQSNGEDRAHALSLMFALAISSGSLGDVLKMIIHLKDGVDALPASSAPFVKRLEEMNTPLKLSWPSPSTIVGDFRAKLSQDEAAKECSDFCSTIAGDGMHLYVWNGLTKSIVKLGTGFHGTIAGTEYMVNSGIEAQLKDRLGTSIYGNNEEIINENTTLVAEDSTVPNTSDTVRRLRLTRAALVVVVDPDNDLAQCFEDENFEDTDMLEAGFETEIISEHSLCYPGTEESCMVYGIGDDRYVVSVDTQESDSSSNTEGSDEESDSNMNFVLNLEIIEPSNGSGTGRITQLSDGSKRSAVYTRARIASANGKIYLWMSYLLGPFRVAIFSTSALKLEDIEYVTLPVPELIKGRRMWEKSLMVEGGNGEESKEEFDLQEEKVGEDLDVEEEEEFEIRPEKVLCSPGSVSVTSTSSIASNVAWNAPIAEVLGGSDFSLESDHEPLRFNDGDDDQTIIIDLGAMYVPGTFGAKLRSIKTEFGVEFRHELFEIWVSANNIEFFKYGSCVDVSTTDVMIGTPAEYVGPVEIQYVKYRFGSKAILVSKLFASGSERVKVIKSLPCPIMCSDGRYLTFLSVKRGSKSEPGCKLRVMTVDPLHRMSIKSDSVFDFDINLEQLENASFATNGEYLVMIHRSGFKIREKNEKTVDFTCAVFNLLARKEEGSHKATFSEKSGYPQAISYDSRNNCLWSWDNFENRVLRWRNAGYAPRFLPPRPAKTDDLLFSDSPIYRLEALASLSASSVSLGATDAARILCQIDRLADLHSPPIHSMADSKAYNEIEVASAGFEDGCFCRLMHRGQIVHEASRGFNIALLNDQFEVTDSRVFDTHASEASSDRMADFIESMEEGSIVLVGVMDSAKAELTSRGISALKTLGADRLDKLSNRSSYALIGYKGANADSANVTQIMTNKKEGAAVVKQRIPSPKVPLAVESSPLTVKNLVGLISKQYALFKEKKASDIDNMILLTCIRLLTTNIFHLLRGAPSEEIAEFLSADEKASLISFVIELINDPPKDHGGFAIARAALRLFINSIDVLYVSAADKCTLLIQYLKEFVDGTLSILEKSVLELLLRQMSNPMSLAKILTANDPSLLVASLASIAEKETISRIEKHSSAYNAEGSGVGDASVQMLSTLCNMIISQSIDDVMSSDEITPQVSGGVNKVLQLFLQVADISVSIMEKGIVEAAAIAASKESDLTADDTKFDKEIDELMKNSPAGALLPIILFNIAHIASVNTHKFVSSEEIDAVSLKLEKCISTLQTILSKLPKKELSVKSVAESSYSKTASQVVESPHPYQSNSDLNWDLNFPNAIRMTIVFDSESKTENNYDYVIIWKDSTKQEKLHPGIEKYTGRGGSEVFAGVGSTPPLVIEGNTAFVEFHSDGSNEDWGFRFTATAEFKPASTSSVQRHWAFDLERQLGYCGSKVAAAMIEGTRWNAAVERPYMNIIEDDMLQGEFRKELGPNAIPNNMKLLFDLASGCKEQATQEFCQVMKRIVLEDRGQMEDINRAVHATAAVLIKFNGLAAEAHALCSGSRSAPSDTLIKVWKSSQKMRHYFDLSDLKAVQSVDTLLHPPPVPIIPSVGDDDDLPPAIGLTRGPSLYSGAGEDTKRNASDCVVARCQFLLRIDDSVSDTDSSANEISNPSAGKKMWRLLSKNTSKIVPKLQRDMSVENKWHNVVGAAQFANQLKELISYRRMAAQRKGGSASITERVLSFVQSNASVTQLEEVRTLRDNRAMLRASGLKLVNNLIGSNASPFCVSLLVSSVQRAFRSAQSPERPLTKAHYLNGIEGSSPAVCGEVVGHFSNFIRGCTAYISSAYDKFLHEKDDSSTEREVIISCLKSLSFDYDMTTHNILLKAGIVSMIGILTKSLDEGIRGRAWDLYELLLLRCCGISSSKDLPDEPSDFTANVLSFIISELDKATAPLQLPASHGDLPFFPVTICGSEIREITPDSLGFSFPHVRMGVENSVCLWIRRQSGENEAVLSSRAAAVPQMRVIRGPDFDQKLQEDGDGVFNKGTITKVERGGIVAVQWDGAKGTKTYKYGAEVEGNKIYEVSLIDESVGGHIYSKGAPAVFEDGENVKWSSFGLSMLPDARLCFVAANGEKNWFTHASKARVPAGEWTFVTVVQDNFRHLIYLNGEIDSEATLPSSLVFPDENAKEIHVVESSHPYPDNSDTYTVVDIPQCFGYTITFDDKSRTELNYDFITFYKDDSHTEYWGNEKYHGGRGTSNRNFPGINGNPPLHIPAGRFVIHFKSDGSNNDWGYKIYCSMEMPVKDEDGREKYTNFNDLPFYIGQTPSYVTNIDAPSSLDGDICNVGLFPRSLSSDDIKGLNTSTAFLNVPRIDESHCLNLLSMLRRCCEIPGAPVTSALSCPQVIHSTLRLVARGPHVAAVSALRFCGVLLPNADPEVVDVQASKVGMCELSPGCFVDMLLRTMGNTFNSWRGFLSAERPMMASCGEAAFGSGWESVLLLHSLLGSEKWLPIIYERVGQVVEITIPSILASLLAISRQEASKPTGELGKTLHVGAADLSISFGVLGLLCGAPDGLNVGAKARCTVGEGDGMLEECTILSPTYPEKSDDPLKSFEPKTFGNAIAVVLDSQPTEYLIVDRKNIAPTDRSILPAVENFLKAQETRLQAMFTLFVRSDCSDQRPILKPKVVESDKEVIVESKHPYGPNETTVKEINLKGAKSYRVEFDPQCRTVNANDFVRFYKDQTLSEHIGESKYFGKDSSQNWPGVPGRDKPPLIINAESFVIHFSSNSDTLKDWGYKCTIKAHCVEKTVPPLVPPLLHLAVASDMKAYALKSLDFMLRRCPWFIKTVIPLLKDLTLSALTPSPKFDVSGVAMKPLVIESPHPYENNSNIFTPYRIRGAKKLTIIFDPQTRTESGCDYLKFFKDASHGEMWGEQYTGGKDNGNSNWPGMNGRPPLVIPADSFVLHFKSDSSVNDWGYKFTVLADGGGGGSDDLDKLSAPDRSFRHHCIQQLLLEAPARMQFPSNLSEFDVGNSFQNPVLLSEDDIYLDAVELSVPESVQAKIEPVIRRPKHLPRKSDVAEQSLVMLRPVLYDEGLTLNTEQIVCKPSMDSFHSNKTLHYCGRMVGRERYSPKYNNNCCDGRCGPTNGCQCKSCAEIDEMTKSNRPRPRPPDGVNRPADSCLNFHPLTICDKTTAWSCDGLVEPGGCKSGTGRFAYFVNCSRWRCEQCDFDYCGPCLSSRMGAISSNVEKKRFGAVVDQYFISLPALFYVNGTDCAILKVYAEKTTESNLIATIEPWQTVTAVAEDGDWVRVTTEAKESGWAQRKSRDLVYLIPDYIDEDITAEESRPAAVSSNTDLVTLEDEANTFEVVMTNASRKHPMYEVLDDVVATAGARKTTLPAPCEVLKGRSGYIEKAAMMASTVSSIGYAKSSVTTCLAHWPVDFPFSIDFFGGGTLFLSYVRAAFAARDSGLESGIADVSDLNAIKNRILDLIRTENAVGGDQACAMLINFALRQLNDSLKMTSTLRPTRAVLKELECQHPYIDNMDEMYELSIPGAKWLKIVFDKQSSTEKDCDYVEFYKDRSKVARWSDRRFTGRSGSSDKRWPGVQSEPPLVVKNDNCIVYFHTDSSNTDWGWKLKCYGIMEEPTEEEVVAVEELKSAANRPRPDMAYWLLDFLALEQSAQAQKVLFSARTIKTLREVMDSMPNNSKTPVIHLITNMLQTIEGVDISAQCKSELELFRNSVVVLADSLHRNESGSSNEVSQVLQAVMQAVIVFDTALAGIAQKSNALVTPADEVDIPGAGSVPLFVSRTPLSDLQWNDTGGFIVLDCGGTMRLSESSIPTAGDAPNHPSEKSVFSTFTGGFSLGSGGKTKPDVEAANTIIPSVAVGKNFVMRTVKGFTSSFGFSLKIECTMDSISDPFTGSVGIAYSQEGVTDFALSWSSQKLSVQGRDSVYFGPLLRSGDIISLAVDVENKTIDLYRNFAYVGLAVGPSGSGAYFEGAFFDNSGKALYPAALLVTSGISLQFVEAPKHLYYKQHGSSADDNASNRTPEWIQGFLETSNLLQAFCDREIPSAMLMNSFLPKCEDSRKVVLESDHPYIAVPHSKSIHIEGAQKLIVHIDSQTKMNEDDELVFKSTNSSGGDATSVSVKGAEGGTQSELLDVTVCPGDRVVRGPSWTWGDQDEGVGNIGTVTNVLAWKGVPGTAVEVVWDSQSKFLKSNFVGMYRWGFEGNYDLTLVAHGVGKRPLVFNSNSLVLDILVGNQSNKSTAKVSKHAQQAVWCGCARFDGIDTIMRFDSEGELELTGDFTLECWVRPQNTNSYVAPIICRQLEIETRQDQLSVGLVKEDDFWTVEVKMLNVTFQSYLLCRGGVVPLDSWSHIAVTLAGSLCTIYIDGVEVSSTRNVAGSRSSSMGAPLTVGANEGGEHFKGHLYDLRLWNVARNAADIKKEKNAPLSPPPANVVLSSLVGEDILPFDADVPPPALPEGSLYGYKITIKPVFTLQQVTSSDLFKRDLELLVQEYSLGTLRHDVNLVRYINHTMRQQKKDIGAILNCSWSDIAPSPEELTRWPVLEEFYNVTCGSARNTPAVSPAAAKLPQQISSEGDSPSVANNGPDALEIRFKLIQLLNRKLHDSSMKYIDLCMSDKPWSIAYLLLQSRGVILEAIKEPFWSAALNESSITGSQFEVRLSRSRAIKHARTGLPDHDGRFMTFSQAFRAIHPLNPSTLRRSGQLYNTIFVGEYAQDVGGPYRESFAQYCAELQSASLPLLVRTSNGRQSAGQNREMWVLNPGSASLTHMEMFSFLGKLMGIAIRGKEYLALNIAPIIWKLLVQDVPTIEDLEGIDYHQVKVLKEIRHSTLSPQIFSMAYEDIGFTCVSTDDRTVNLLPGGANMALTYDNRAEYCDLLENYRLHEFDLQAEAIRRGLSTIVPMRLLSLFTWDQLEMMVCGVSTVDIALLRSVTEYSSCSANDAHIRNFWQVLEEFTEEERAAFLKFTWGRSRLPLSAGAFAQRFKLQSFGKSPADNYLPVSHTCFFSLELPRYSSIDVMREKLRYAITHCLAIDGDDTNIGMQAAAMGWEE